MRTPPHLDQFTDHLHPRCFYQPFQFVQGLLFAQVATGIGDRHENGRLTLNFQVISNGFSQVNFRSGRFGSNCDLGSGVQISELAVSPVQ